MEKMADWKERYLQLWNKTTKRQRLLMGSILALNLTNSDFRQDV